MKCNFSIHKHWKRKHTAPAERKARNALESALDIWDRRHIEDGTSVSFCLNNLGTLSLTQNDFVAARRYLTRAYEVRRHELGEDSPALVSCYNNLGILECETGHYDLSEKWFKKALAITERVRGKHSAEAEQQRLALNQLYEARAKSSR